jgi:two-component system phosphate regulon sensor histidine kinase PhoR
MQSISLGRFLGPVLLKFCLIATISLVLGFVAGPKAGWVLAATLLALYVCGFVFALYRTVRWMEASQQTLALQAPVDEWNSIASLLYRTRKLERAVRQELDQSVEQLRQILEQIPDGVVIVDAALNIQWGNRTAEQHLCIDVKRDVGLRLTNLARDPAFIQAVLGTGSHNPPSRVTMAASGLTLQVQSLAFSSDQWADFYPRRFRGRTLRYHASRLYCQCLA